MCDDETEDSEDIPEMTDDEIDQAWSDGAYAEEVAEWRATGMPEEEVKRRCGSHYRPKRAVFVDPSLQAAIDADAALRGAATNMYEEHQREIGDEQMTLMEFVSYPYHDLDVIGPVAMCQSMLSTGKLPEPDRMTPDQATLWHKTIQCMEHAAAELKRDVSELPLPLPQIDWKVLVRGGVAWRVHHAPGESNLIAAINALRGERRIMGSAVTRLWEQLATPRGHADAILDLCAHLQLLLPVQYTELDIPRYVLSLQDVLPTLRRTTKPNQEKRIGR